MTTKDEDDGNSRGAARAASGPRPEAVKRKPPPTVPPENVCARCGAIAPDFPADGRLYCSPTCLELERRGVPHGE
jgi:hypothetical protein